MLQTVSACVATLNNLCASEEGADRVFEEAKRFAPHVSSERSCTEQHLSDERPKEALDTNAAPTALPMLPSRWRHCTCEAVLGQAFHLKADGICRGLTE